MRDASAVEAVWGERAQRLSRHSVSIGPAQNAFPVLVLGIAEEQYAIDLPDVAEVFPHISPTPVPGAPAAFAGVINVHGEIRPVIDLRRYLNIERPIETSENVHARVILLRKAGREMGLQIDRVEHIRWIAAGELQAPEGEGAERSRHIKGSTADLLMLLSTEALFDQVQPLDTGVPT